MTKWEMVKAGWGSYSEYREACLRAKASGWTLEQVQTVLALTDPLAVMLLWPAALAGIAGIAILTVGR